ncbi:MAG: DUF2442 domain-containing protein [Actinomycetota bacterium]|nr:DUF2442 domain-containing protein [Actinomycetota bacterium]
MTRAQMVRISSVEPIHDFVVRLGFTDGTVRDLDLSSFLWGPVFEPLKSDPELFALVRVDPEAGTIVWPNGADLDPDMLYERALRQAG